MYCNLYVVAVVGFFMLLLTPPTTPKDINRSRRYLPKRNAAASVKPALDKAAPVGSSHNPLPSHAGSGLRGTEAKIPAATASKASVVDRVATASKASVQSGESVGRRDLLTGATNQAVYAGTDSVTLECVFDPDSANDPRVMWYEYAWTTGGGLISENNQTLGHPQAARYKIDTTLDGHYDLVISNVLLGDGGTYLCMDSNADVGFSQFRYGAQLIVLDGPPDCSITIPNGGVVIEGHYHSGECTISYQGNIHPNLLWEGPPPFSQTQTVTATSVWCGFNMYASRTMSSQYFDLNLNFTGYFLPPPQDMDDTIPTLTDMIASTDRLNVQWPPSSLYAEPMNPDNNYNVGDSITCTADAFPTASYFWISNRTLERFDSDTFTIGADWVGTFQMMRCTANNSISGLPYTADLSIIVNVPAPTTTTPIPTTTPTTTPPAFSDCFDTTGPWSSTFPTVGALCILVDQTNAGLTSGGYRNATDTYWGDITGNAEMAHWEHVSWVTILPKNAAVSSFIAECFRCDGLELLLVNVVQRSKMDGGICGQPGPVTYSQELTFTRDATLKCANFIPPGR